jgi:hypothetical protein
MDSVSSVLSRPKTKMNQQNNQKRRAFMATKKDDANQHYWMTVTSGSKDTCAVVNQGHKTISGIQKTQYTVSEITAPILGTQNSIGATQAQESDDQKMRFKILTRIQNLVPKNRK